MVPSTTSPNLLDALIRLAIETSFDQLPAQTVRSTQAFLLDSLAVGVAGRRGPDRNAVVEVAKLWGEGRAARLLGDGLRLPAPSAAFVNAFQMHCLEFDCVHEGAVVHAMTAVAGAALAECDRCAPIDGPRLLVATALGTEVAAVLGLAAAAPLTFFRPATAGVFGAAVAVGVLRGFDAGQLRACFGHALCQAAGTMQAHEEGKSTLAVQLGGAARGGLVAADLAGAGVPAPADALEGRYGYLRLFERCHRATGLAESLGEAWRVDELSHKPYPSGRATHGAVEAVIMLRGRGVTVENLARVTLSAPPLIHQLVVRPPKADMTANYARLCFGYVGAVALADGDVGLDRFDSRALADAETLALAQRFKAVVNDVGNPAAFTPQCVTAELRDGAELKERIDTLPGSRERPLTANEVRKKLAACVGSVYGGPTRTAALNAAVGALPDATDASSVLDAVTGTP